MKKQETGNRKQAVAPKTHITKPAAARLPAGKAGKPRVAKEKEPVVAAKVEALPEVTAAPVEEVKQVFAKIPHGKSYYAVGRRKTAVAQILMTAGNGTITINKLPFEKYFQTSDLQQIATNPLRQIGMEKQFNVKAKIHGGGIHAQAEGLRHAISRGLIDFDPESRRTLKKLGFLTRDPRVKERKKPGLKRARRAPQFSKR